MNLGFRDIEYFLVMAELGHMGRAAAACGVTQPALSKSLRRLEEETGLRLFDRITRRIQLSASGLAFMEHARRLQTEYRDAVRHTGALQAGQAGLLRIGATSATLDTVVMPTLAVLLPRRPALRVCLTTGLSDDLFEGLAQGSLDMVVAPTYADSLLLDSYTLSTDSLDVVARKGHPLLAKAKLSLSDLQAFPWIGPSPQASAYRVLFRSFEEAGLPPPTVAMEVAFISEGMLDIVAATDILSIAIRSSSRSIEKDLVVLPIRLPVVRKISLLTRQGGTWTPLMRAFHDGLLERMAAS